VREPQLQELIASSRDRLSATTDYIEAMLGSQITVVIVPTPSDERGAFSNEYVLASIREIGLALRKKKRIPRGERPARAGDFPTRRARHDCCWYAHHVVFRFSCAARADLADRGQHVLVREGSALIARRRHDHDCDLASSMASM